MVFCASFATGYGTAQRFQIEGDEQTCRVGCPNEPDSLSLSPITTNALSCTICLFQFGDRLTVLPRRRHLLHDLITQVFLRSLQYGIVVMGFIDAFVYAHQHRRSIDNPGNFGDCMKGMGHLYRWGVPALWMVKPLLDGVLSLDLSMEE